MTFYDKKRECKACRSEFEKDGNGNDICIVQHSLLCNAVSCPSSHYWAIGKQKQIGWTSSRSLERTGLVEAFMEDMGPVYVVED